MRRKNNNSHCPLFDPIARQQEEHIFLALPFLGRYNVVDSHSLKVPLPPSSQGITPEK